jgi:DNA-binding transcriptional regulator GbsR (MarR family)
MSDADLIPDTFLNKSQISEKYGMSRVTVNKHLKILESSGRVIPTIVQQGSKKTYRFNPVDLDVAFSSLSTTNKKLSNVKGRVYDGSNVKLENDIELLKKDLELERRVAVEKEKNISNLEERISELKGNITDLRNLLGYEPSSTPAVAVVPPIIVPEEPTPSTVADIKVAMVEASNDGPAKQQQTSLGTKDTETEAEARRARIDQHLQKKEVEPELPAYVKPRGFISWLRGY